MSTSKDSIQEEFNELVGLIIKDPMRLTCDTDPEAEKISALARKHSLHVNFVKSTEPEDPFMADVEAVHVDIEPAGQGWEVKGFYIG